jgi:putative transposase
MIDKEHTHLSMERQCELISIHRSGLYYKPCGETSINLELMQVIDREYTRLPFYGVARMTGHLNEKGYQVNVKRIRRLYHKMALRAIYPKPSTTIADKDHYKYPYLLRGLVIDRPNQVWATDITYIPMKHGFMYLVAIVDLYSRFVVGWGLSNTLDANFCIEVLKTAIKRNGPPAIFNSDQGIQFTCKEFIEVLTKNEIKISMDGKGRAIDNIFVERLWRSVKYENIYLHAYDNGLELYQGLKEYFDFYNNERVHQGLDYEIPARLYHQAA